MTKPLAGQFLRRRVVRSLSRTLQCTAVLMSLAPLVGGPRVIAPNHSAALRRPNLSAGRGYPFINFGDGFDIDLRYAGNPRLLQVVENGENRPLSLATADFDEDGMPDVVAGHATADGGMLALHRGNLESVYPKSAAAQTLRARGILTAEPFHSPAMLVELPVTPDFMAAGDFDGDGHWDVVVAAAGGASLYLLPGDGKGGFRAPSAWPLTGTITAFASGEVHVSDGLTDFAVAVSSEAGPHVLVYHAPEGALMRPPEVHLLPAEATAMLMGHLDNDAWNDLAIATGRDLHIARGTLSARQSVLERHTYPFEIRDLAVGDFIGDGEFELALLASDGSLHLQPTNFDDTVTQVVDIDRSIFNLRTMNKSAEGRRELAAQSSKVLLRARISSIARDNLIVLDAVSHSIRIVYDESRQELRDPLSGNRAPAFRSIALDVDAEPLSFLPMRLNGDALDDLVVLKQGRYALAGVVTAPVRTFTVNSNGDGSDTNLNDNVCNAGGGLCTLRAAIQQANTSAGEDAILFTGVSSINPATALPFITEALTIDGTAADGRLEISGAALPTTADILTISGSNVVIRDLVLHSATHNGLEILGSGSNRIEGNYFGTDAAGTGLRRNRTYDLEITSPSNTIGGTTAAARNVIPGNRIGLRIYVFNSTPRANVIQGNFVGVDATGTKIIGQTVPSFVNDGIYIQNANETVIGGTTAGAGNVVSGNAYGIYVDHGSATRIQGNNVGADVTGAKSLGNSNVGIRLISPSGAVVGGAGAGNVLSASLDGMDLEDSTGGRVEANFIGTDRLGKIGLGNNVGLLILGGTSGSTNNTIGGSSALGNVISGNGNDGLRIFGRTTGTSVSFNLIGTGLDGITKIANSQHGIQILTATNSTIDRNTIAYNGKDGVLVSSGTGHKLTANSIFENGQLGIDLGDDGVTPNDNSDADTGANDLQNFPVLTVNSSGGIDGTLKSIASKSYTIEFFSNPTCDPLGYGEGKAYLSSMSVTTDATGSATFKYSGSIPSGQVLTATATDANGNTSEFCACAKEKVNDPFIVNTTSDEDDLNRGDGNFDGKCDIDAATPGDQCSLRAAIQEANNHPGKDFIRFAIPGTGIPTIRPQRVLPEIFSVVEIDGTTQPAGKVEIDGSLLTDFLSGLVLSGGNSSVTGLVINRFYNSAIVLRLFGGNTIKGNFLGTDPTGTKTYNRQGYNGIRVEENSSGNTIGGVRDPRSTRCAGDCNLISGWGFYGVDLYYTNSTITGNFMGTDVEGNASLGNFTGLRVYKVEDMVVGGRTPGMGNVISGNTESGIELYSCNRVRIEGNLIGTNSAGDRNLGNALYGVDIISSLSGGDNIIGGTTAAAGNIIAFNGSSGVGIQPGTGNRTSFNRIFSNKKAGISISSPATFTLTSLGNVITKNAIYSNSKRGIVLQDEVPKNDMLDRDQGPNNLQNFPHIYWALRSKGKTILTTELQSTASTTFDLEFFTNTSPDASHYGQGAEYIGSAKVTTDAQGWARKTVILPVSVSPEDWISATATHPIDGTSEFSLSISVFEDSDGDGVSDVEEVLYGGDPKSAKVVGTQSNGRPIKVTTDADELILGLFSAEPAIVSSKEYALVLGVLQKILHTPASSAPGHLAVLGPTTVTIFLPPGVRADTYLNYGPTTDNAAPHWYEFLYDGKTGAEIKTDRIILHYLDGQRGDHDLLVNGEIVTEGGPAVVANALYFPFYQADANTFTGFALSNFSDEPALLTFSAFGTDGNAIPLPGNSESVYLDKRNQLSQLGSQIFRADGTIPEAGWVRVSSSNSNLGTLFLFGSNDLGRMDGSLAFTATSTKLYFTRVFEGPTAFLGKASKTYFSIANPGTQSSTVRFRLVPPSGAPAPPPDKTVTLPARGCLYQTLSQLFGSTVASSGGYLIAEVTQGSGIVGFELVKFDNYDTLIGLNGSVGNTATQSFSAQLATGGGYFTSVKLINTSAQARTATVSAISEAGSPLGTAVAVQLAAGASVEQDMQKTFSLPTNTLTVGSIKVDANGDGVIGDVMFGDPDTYAFAASIPLQTQRFTKAVFSQVANGAGYFTGLALYNPGTASADVTIEVFSSKGVSTGKKILALGPGRRISQLIPQIVPSTEGQVGGYVVITSTQPVVGQQVFGESSLRMLSAVPPAIIQ